MKKIKVEGFKNVIEDLSGQKFGQLTVLNEVKKIKRAHWLCRCDCGKELFLEARNIKSNHTRSCGCLYEYNDSSIAPFNDLYGSYKAGAKFRKLSFNISEDEFRILTKQNCNYCGSPPSNTRKKTNGPGVYIFNGLDRVNNDIGYEMSNIVSCCGICNIMKKMLTTKQLIDQARKIATFTDRTKEQIISHKASIKMKINDRTTLCQTLDALGVQYEIAGSINGLGVTSRYGVKADVDVLLKQDSHGHKMNAVGFRRNDDGTYEATGDFYEINGSKTKEGERLDQNSFKDAIGKRYTYMKALNQLSQLGFGVGTEVADFKAQELNFSMISYN